MNCFKYFFFFFRVCLSSQICCNLSVCNTYSIPMLSIFGPFLAILFFEDYQHLHAWYVNIQIICQAWHCQHSENSVHSWSVKITHLEFISLISERKRTFSPLNWFSSAQAGEHICIWNLIIKMKDKNGIKSVQYLINEPYRTIRMH